MPLIIDYVFWCESEGCMRSTLVTLAYTPTSEDRAIAAVDAEEAAALELERLRLAKRKAWDTVTRGLWHSVPVACAIGDRIVVIAKGERDLEGSIIKRGQVTTPSKPHDWQPFCEAHVCVKCKLETRASWDPATKTVTITFRRHGSNQIKSLKLLVVGVPECKPAHKTQEK